MPNQRVAIVSIDGDLIDTIQSEQILRLVGVFDFKSTSQKNYVELLGDDAEWADWHERNLDVQVILAVDRPEARKRLLDNYRASIVTGFCSARAYVSPRAKIKTGVIIQRNVSISAGVHISEYTKINTDVVIHHDCEIGKFVTLAPGARLLGNVKIMDEAYVGASAVILPGLVIGKASVIGAGAVVTRSISDYETVVGCPAKPLLIRSNEIK